MQNTVLQWGCNSLEEASKETSLQRKRWTSTGSLCTRWLSHISERWRVEWNHLISRPDALEKLKTPGTLQLLSGQDDTAQSDPGWTDAGKCWIGRRKAEDRQSDGLI